MDKFSAYLVLVYSLLFGWGLKGEPIDYRVIWPEDYQRSLQFLQSNRQQIDGVCSRYHSDTATITATIFPELIRYSLWRDFFETKALETVYVEYGSHYADFSIGHFQMKPSFVEKLEAYVAADCRLSERFGRILRYPSSVKKNIRKERIRRLQTLEWQMTYVCCFYEIVSDKFNYLTFPDKTEKIRFFAAAYNRGFDEKEAVIRRAMHRKTFPYGSQYPGNPYCYSKIASDYYQRYYALKTADF